MTHWDRSDPDWTFDDSWQEPEPEPVLAVPCPCCAGLGHYWPAAWGGGGLSCTGRYLRTMRELQVFVHCGRTPESPAGTPEDLVSCWRCHDTGVMPAERNGLPV